MYTYRIIRTKKIVAGSRSGCVHEWLKGFIWVADKKTGEWGGGGDRQGIEFLFFPQKYYADNGEFHGSQLEFMIAVKH